MIFKNFKIHAPVFVLLSLLALVSCSSKVEDQNETVNNATFDLLEISGTPIQDEKNTSSPGWSNIPRQRSITFKACLIENAVAQSIIGEAFHIISSLGKISPDPITDGHGCLTWSQTFNFSYLAREKYLKYAITLSGRGSFQGQKKIVLGVNPWNQSTDAVKDLRYHKNLTLTGHNNPQEITSELRNNLILENISIKKIDQRPNKKEKQEIFTYEYSMAPKFIRKKLDGAITTPEAFKQGNFKLAIIAVEKTVAGESKNLAKTFFQKAIHSDLQLKGRFDLGLSKIPHPDSKIVFLIELTPLAPPALLTSFKGVLAMEHLNKNSSSNILPVEGRNDSSRHGKKKKKRFSKIKNLAVTNDNNYGFNIAPFKFSVGSSLDDGSYNKSSKRKIYTRLRICLDEAASAGGAAPVKNKNRFKVHGLGHNGAIDSSRERIHEIYKGCFDSYILVNYDIYETEEWLPMTIIIEGVDGLYAGIKKARKICVNPWSDNADFALNMGLTGVECPTVQGVKDPSVHLSNISYKYQRIDTSSIRINKFLHMSHKRKFEIKLFPTVAVHYRSKARQNNLPKITFGEFNILFSIYIPKQMEVDFKNINLNQFSFLTAGEKTVTVSPDGIIEDEILLPFTALDVQKLPYKNLLVIKISPKNTSSPLASSTVAIPFYGLNRLSITAHGKKLTPRDADLNYQKTLAGIRDKQNPLAAFEIPFLKKGNPSSETSTTALYRESIKKILSKKYPGINFFHSDINTLNKISMNGGHTFIKRQKIIEHTGEVTPRTVREYSFLNHHEFRSAVSQAGFLPSRTANKFCRHIFNLPTLSSNYFIGNIKVVKGQEFVDCYANPREHLEITPLAHIEDILSKKYIKGLTKRVPIANFVNNSIKTLSRGRSYFAEEGEQYNQNNGSQESQTFEAGASISGSANPLAFIGGGIKFAQEQVIFKGRIDSHTHSNNRRFYTKLNISRLLIDHLEVEFEAKVKKCVSVMSKKHHHRQLHICDTHAQFMRVRENWYFISEENSLHLNGAQNNNSYLNGPTIIQVIRGRANFLKQWASWKSQDSLWVIRSMDHQLTIGKDFKIVSSKKQLNSHDRKILLDGGLSALNEEGIINLPYQGYSDNAFPAIVIPTGN